MNVLSGTVWKGAKLRIGDAKPDYRERCVSSHSVTLALIHFPIPIRFALSESLPPPPPKKRRLGSHSTIGTHTPDMSLITPETAHTRGGWRVTEMGRVVRVMRMRPERPLEPPRATTSAGRKKHEVDGKSGTGKRKKRVKRPPTRARRRTIDPTHWDSMHLKGMWLDAEVVGAVETGVSLGRSGHEDQARFVKRYAGEVDSSDDEHDAESAVTESEADDHRSVASVVPESAVAPLPALAPSPGPTARPPPTESAAGGATSLSQEKFASLALLRSLFSDKDGEEGWGGQESLSDIEDARLEGKGNTGESQAGTRMVIDEDGGIEEVPRAKFKDMEIGSDTSDGVGSPLKSQPQPVPQPGQTIQNQTQTKLKDLFAPREDEGAFFSQSTLSFTCVLASHLSIPAKHD